VSVGRTLAFGLAAAAGLWVATAAPARAGGTQAPAAGTQTAAGEAPTAGRKVAPHRKIVGILDVRVDGVSSTAAERFESSIEEGLGSTEYWVATRKRMREILAGGAWNDGCVFGPCILEVKKQTGADLVVVAYFHAVGSSYQFVVSLVETTHGSVVAQVADHCDVCTLSEALDSAALATIGLVHGAGEPGVGFARSGAGQPAAVDRRSHRRSLRRTALLLVGAAAIAGGTGAYFLRNDRNPKLGYSAVGAAAGLGVAGFTVLGLSFRF
jgi:hypothetical protein